MLSNAGIGDILITKMILQSLNLKNKVVINKELVKIYRNDSDAYYKFIEKLEDILFVNQTEPALNIHSLNLQDKITKFLLIEYFKKDLKNVFDFDYITLSTKTRYDDSQNAFMNNDLSIIIDFFKNFTVDCPIVLLGERELKGNQYSLYKHYMEVLSENNDIIDYTSDVKLSTEPDWNMFIRDLSILNNSKLNIMFGYGGNFVMTIAISNSNIGYIRDISHPFLNIVGSNFHRNLNEFMNEIKLKIQDM